MEDLLKLIQQLGRKHDNLRVFQDFVEICACSISRPFINREDRYFAIYSRYTDEEMQQFYQMGQILLHESEKAPQDILGQCYMQLELANKQRGQCFTPLSIGNLMASILFRQEIE